MAKRGRKPKNRTVILKEKTYHGRCDFIDCNPDVRFENGVKNIFFKIPFEEAAKLSIAIHSTVLNLNKYNRVYKKGKNMGLRITFYMNTFTKGGGVAVREDTMDVVRESAKKTARAEYKKKMKILKSKTLKI